MSVKVAPFFVKDGNVYIKNTFLENGIITRAKIANAAITSAKLKNGSITNAKIGYATIDKLTVGGSAVCSRTSISYHSVLNIPADSGSFFDICSPKVYISDIDGVVVDMFFSMSWYPETTTYGANTSVKIKMTLSETGEIIYEDNDIFYLNGYGTIVTRHVRLIPESTGYKTIKIQNYHTNYYGGAIASARSIDFSVIKR